MLRTVLGLQKYPKTLSFPYEVFQIPEGGEFVSFREFCCVRWAVAAGVGAGEPGVEFDGGHGREARAEVGQVDFVCRPIQRGEEERWCHLEGEGDVEELADGHVGEPPGLDVLEGGFADGAVVDEVSEGFGAADSPGLPGCLDTCSEAVRASIVDHSDRIAG